MDWGPLKDRLIEAAAAAALLGGGATVVGHSVDIARQDARIERVEKLDERLEEIQKDVATTREAVIRLETKLEK
jgi:ribosomal protein L13E